MKWSQLVILSFILVLSACKKDTPEPPNEEELITDVVLTLTPTNGGDQVQFLFNDPDGEGGVQGMVINDTLQANTVYTGSLSLTNTSESPVEDITLEIIAEADEHQFFYEVASSLNLSVEYADVDSNQDPLGLLINLTTGEASSGNLKITLIHEPEKGAEGVSGGLITNAGGEIDVEVSFMAIVQ